MEHDGVTLAIASDVEDDGDSIMQMNPTHEYLEAKKQHALVTIPLVISATMALSMQQVKVLCAGKTIHSAARCKAAYIGHLKRLRKRLANTTTAKDGMVAFQDDIMQLMLNVEDVVNGNLYGSVDIRYRKYVPHKCMPKACD